MFLDIDKNLVYIHVYSKYRFSIKVFVFCLKSARKRGITQITWTPFTKSQCSTTIIKLYTEFENLFNGDFTIFEKYIVGCPS